MKNLRHEFKRFNQKHPEATYNTGLLGVNLTVLTIAIMTGNAPVVAISSTLIAITVYREKQNARKTSFPAAEGEIYELNRGQKRELDRLSYQMNRAAKKLETAKTDKAHTKLNTRLEELDQKKNKILTAENVRKVKAPQNA